MSEEIKFTVGELKRHLENTPDDMELIFQGGGTFYRFKQRDENLLQLEFNEVMEIVPGTEYP